MLLPEEVKPFICNEEKIVREHAVNYLKIGRNEPCICGSREKYKKCCGRS